MDGLVQDCSISIASALEILQFCIKLIAAVSQIANPIEWDRQHLNLK